MSSVHRPAPEGPMRYTCAQAGCQVCMEELLRQHGGLVQWVIRRDCRSDVAYAELVHEGQIAVWQAIMHYDPGRGVAFSSYAVPAIRHRLWRLVRETQRPQGHGMLAAADDPAELVAQHPGGRRPEWAAQAWQRQAVRAALGELLAHLPERSYHVMVSAYGLDGEAPLSLAEIGRLLGLSRERVRQLRNDALVVLRLPALSGRLLRSLFTRLWQPLFAPPFQPLWTGSIRPHSTQTRTPPPCLTPFHPWLTHLRSRLITHQTDP